MILGANDEDDARALAEQLQGELPGEATIHVEPGTGTAWEWLGDRPFAVFGGLSRSSQRASRSTSDDAVATPTTTESVSTAKSSGRCAGVPISSPRSASTS